LRLVPSIVAVPTQEEVLSRATEMSKADYEAPGAEDEDFEYEDEMDPEEGLTVEQTKQEKDEFAKYVKMYSTIILVFQLLAWGTYLLTNLLREQKRLHEIKLDFIYENQLGYVYLALFMVYLARTYLSINSNAARAPTGLARPDQHVYTGKVLMDAEGAAGRFNRAQRAAYNMDEGLPLYSVALILAGYVFGPVMLIPASLTLVGRIIFGNTYKKSVDARTAGFMMGMIGEAFTHGLVGMIAVKGIFGSRIPF